MPTYKESNILIIIDALKKIISIFLGPFLTAYFLKVSQESIRDISTYYIMNYFVLGTMGMFLGWLIKNKFQVGSFRTGIITNFIYILTIVILKEKIINYLPIISLLYGLSASFYYYPYNLFASSKIKNKDQCDYEFKRKTTQTLVGIIIPFLLGSIISTTNFHLTAVIILIVSIIQVILSFLLTPLDNTNYNFTPIKSFLKLIRNKDVRHMLYVDYFKGMNTADSALDITIVILIINAFKTELNLGIISSISSIFIIIMQFLYTKYFSKRNDKLLIRICSFIPITVLLILLFYTNNITLTLYYFIYTTTINLLALILDVRLFNISNSKIVKEGNFLEFWSIREAILNLGRITGHTLLLIIAITNKLNLLYYLMIVLASTIIITGYFASNTKKYNSIK